MCSRSTCYASQSHQGHAMQSYSDSREAEWGEKSKILALLRSRKTAVSTSAGATPSGVVTGIKRPGK